ncbi:U3 small nucleolar RNA-associated protein [Mycoemilia scoparia]|uniref:U3 small nucleolar RNA-associated protein n=1 Tax=Mycoemilia scoparia TaxID=417184 RepID=A0A9W8DVQ0_9FUNG|nr:U3 small nucleolar RNA-associated protein [Mycoemilia scoparia]
MVVGEGKITLKSCYDRVESIESIYTGGKVVLSKAEDILCTASNEDINVIDTKTGKVKAQLKGDTESVTTFSIKPDGKHLVSASRSLQMTIWDMNTFKVTRSFKAHNAPVIVMDIDVTSTLVATGSADSSVNVWDITGGFCTHSLKGHSGVVTAVRFHPDMKAPRLVSGGDDGSIRIWNLNTRKCEAVLESHSSPVRGLDFTPDGRYLISAGRDSVIHIWDIRIKKLVRTIPVYEPLETVGVLKPDTKLFDSNESKDEHRLVLFSGGSQGIIRLWDFDTGKEIFKQTKEPNSKHACLDVLYAEESQQLVLITTDQNILFYDITNKFQKTRQIAGYNEEITDIKYIGPNKQHVIVATNSEQLRLYNLDNHNCELIYGHSDIILSLDVHELDNNTSLFVSGSKDNTAKVWLVDWKSKSNTRAICVAEAIGHTEAVGAVSLSCKTGCNFLVTGSQDRTVKVWDLSNAAKTQENAKMLKSPKKLIARYTTKAHDKDINSLTIAPNDKVFATGSQDKTAKLWSVSDGQFLGTFQGHRRGIWSVTFSPFDQILATTSGDKTIKLWSLNDFSCIKTLEGHTSSVLSSAFVTSGMQILSVGGDGLVKLWNIKDEECVLTLDEHEDKIWSLSVAGDGENFVTGGADSAIIVWKDTTEDNISRLHKEQADNILKEQALSNYLQAKDYRKAISLAISLDQPHRLLGIFMELINNPTNQNKEQDTDVSAQKLTRGELDSVLGSPDIDTVVKSLAPSHLTKLLGYVRNWNTNVKFSRVAQSVLYCILSSKSSEALLTIPEARELIVALSSYSKRHYVRVDRLLTESFIVDFTLQSMDNLGSVSEESQQ